MRAFCFEIYLNPFPELNLDVTPTFNQKLPAGFASKMYYLKRLNLKELTSRMAERAEFFVCVLRFTNIISAEGLESALSNEVSLDVYTRTAASQFRTFPRLKSPQIRPLTFLNYIKYVTKGFLRL